MEPPDPPCDPSVDLEGWVIQTRLARGLPTPAEDLVILAHIADLIRTHQEIDFRSEDC
jgi:hypothetical protein